MDGIFKKSTNVFDVVSISVKEPYRYDKKGQLKAEYLEEAVRRHSVKEERSENRLKESESPASSD